VRAQSLSAAGSAGAAAARQPFLAGMACKRNTPGKGVGKQQRSGMSAGHGGHVSYTVIRGGEEVSPYYCKHRGKVQQEGRQQQPQEQRQKQQQQQMPRQPDRHVPPPASKSSSQQSPASSTCSGSEGLVCCPFPGCSMNPPSLDQHPVHDVRLPNTSNVGQQAQGFETTEALETHVFSAHRFGVYWHHIVRMK